MKRINGLKVVEWGVEWPGCVGPIYLNTEQAAIKLMGCKKWEHGQATCIARNRKGQGRLLVLGLVK